MTATFETGAIVATPDGRGVVAAVLTEDVEFPQGTDEVVEVTATEDDPAYVVGLEGDGAAAYRSRTLEPSTFDDDAPSLPDGSAETDVVRERIDGLDRLPEGWDRESVLEYWAEIGGDWTACVENLSDEFEEERAKRLCSAMKDEVLGTERWRNRF